MTTTPLLSIKEAADLAGVSKKTVERAFKKHLDDPDFSHMLEKRQQGNGYRYFVSKTFVEQCVSKSTANKTERPDEKVATTSVLVLREQLEVKDRRIDELLQIIRNKEEFTEALIRKGLQLPQGRDVEPATSTEPGDQPATNATKQSTVVDVVNRRSPESETERAQARPISYFPTLRKGLRIIGHILSTEIHQR